MAIVSAENLSKFYGQRMGVDAVNFEVSEGEIFGFLGPNGAGKTTTIRLLLGFLRATSGKSHIFGKDTWKESHFIKRDVGYLPGDLRLYPWMTGDSATDISGKIRGLDLIAEGRKLAERFNLEMNIKVRKMSRGMRQKLGLILALAHKPKLLILDEPTSGLDPLMQEELASSLREMATNGCTIFFSSHTLKEVEDLCDRIAIVKNGRIVADESLESLRSRAKRSVVILFKDAHTAANLDAPSCLTEVERSGVMWRCILDGPIPDLLEWSAKQQLSDMAIGKSDLESIFRGYYRNKENNP